MARPRKVESKLEYLANCCQGAVSLYNQDASGENLDLVNHWAVLLQREATALLGELNAPIVPSSSEQKPFGSDVPKAKQANSSR